MIAYRSVIWKANIQGSMPRSSRLRLKAGMLKIYLDLSKQIIVLTTSCVQEVKAIRTAGSNADWQLFVALLIELKAQIL